MYLESPSMPQITITTPKKSRLRNNHNCNNSSNSNHCKHARRMMNNHLHSLSSLVNSSLRIEFSISATANHSNPRQAYVFRTPTTSLRKLNSTYNYHGSTCPRLLHSSSSSSSNYNNNLSSNSRAAFCIQQ